MTAAVSAFAEWFAAVPALVRAHAGAILVVWLPEILAATLLLHWARRR